jgi:dihydropteroate synthase
MHMQGEPRTMQLKPVYGNVVVEVGDFLNRRRADCIAAGVAADSIVLDPGFGFGKSFAHNMTLLKELKALTELGSPLMVGISRKGMLGEILGKPVGERTAGGLALAALAVAFGARIIRTHDVAATVDAVKAVDAVMQGTVA